MAAKKKAAKAKKATGAGVKRTHVDVNGDVYQSTFAAFVGLKLPIGSHAGFRKQLKIDGKNTFEVEGGKKYNFKVTDKDVTVQVDLTKLPKTTAKKASKKIAKKAAAPKKAGAAKKSADAPPPAA